MNVNYQISYRLSRQKSSEMGTLVKKVELYLQNKRDQAKLDKTTV